MLKYKAFGNTDIGKHRTQNQDSFSIDEQTGVFVLADGMGGMEDGGEASKFVVNEVNKMLVEKMQKQDHKSIRYMIRSIRQTINETNKKLVKAISSHTGSTVVTMIYYNKKAYITNVGDSLAFSYIDDELTQLTPEHNLAWVLVMLKKIKPEETKTHHARHRLTAFMGMEGDIPAYVNVRRLKAGERMLLCSDGLTGMVPESEMKEVLKNVKDTQSAVNQLIQMANDAGGDDNITIVLVDFESS